MSNCVAKQQRKIRSGTKVKTGCLTCRTRKVKCDEAKPSCRKCVSTGRLCGGYEALKTFVHWTVKPVVEPALSGSVAHGIRAQEIELMSKYLSTKTLFNVKLNCEEEARQILEASFTDPLVQNALVSLRALRDDLEINGDGPASRGCQTMRQRFGLQQYSVALCGLASNLTRPSPRELKTTLLCCQLFISIEQVRKDYTAMAHHVIQGLRIMHECKPRPYLMHTGQLSSANHNRLPLLDVFIIKLFAAPCKFADIPVPVPFTASPDCPQTSGSSCLASTKARAIAPDLRSVLMQISASTLKFLDRLSKIDTTEAGSHLLYEKATLLESLEAWLANLDSLQSASIQPELVSMAFLRLFCSILKIVLLGVLECSSELQVMLKAEENRIQSIADMICERVTDYQTCVGGRSD